MISSQYNPNMEFGFWRQSLTPIFYIDIRAITRVNWIGLKVNPIKHGSQATPEHKKMNLNITQHEFQLDKFNQSSTQSKIMKLKLILCLSI